MDVARLASNWTLNGLALVIDQHYMSTSLGHNLQSKFPYEDVLYVNTFIDDSSYDGVATLMKNMRSNVFILLTNRFPVQYFFRAVAKIAPTAFNQYWIIVNSDYYLDAERSSMPVKTFRISSTVVEKSFVPVGAIEELRLLSMQSIETNFAISVRNWVHTKIAEESFYENFYVSVHNLAYYDGGSYFKLCASFKSTSEKLTLCESSTSTTSTIAAVMMPSDPLVVVEDAIDHSHGPDYHKINCLKKLPCFMGDIRATDNLLEFYNRYKNAEGTLHFDDDDYALAKRIKINCCSGIIVDIFKQLISDIGFDIFLYHAPDNNYGQIENGTWNGMMREILTKRAAVAVGAFSVTLNRSRSIDFGYEYLRNSFAVVVRDKIEDNDLGAPFKPFLPSVWVGIFTCAFISGIFMSTFEWISPFGLNPWGRKRAKNYTLASGINSVLSLLFGHIINFKSPKSWPVKVIQNFWAGTCIVVLSSYTANLISFIMGTVNKSTFDEISKDSQSRLAVMMDTTFTEMFDSVKGIFQGHLVYVADSFQGIQMVDNGSVDAFLDDQILLENAFRKMYINCSLRIETILAGTSGYAFGFNKESWLKESFDERMMWYHGSGLLEDVFNSYKSHKFQCKKESKPVSIQNLAGVFLALATGFAISLLILVFEHILFARMLPYCRSREPSHMLKSKHMMFFSQRAYRLIHCEHYLDIKEQSRQMIRMMKDKRFGHMFLKDNKGNMRAAQKQNNFSIYKLSQSHIQKEYIAKAKEMENTSPLQLVSSAYLTNNRALSMPQLNVPQVVIHRPNNSLHNSPKPEDGTLSSSQTYIHNDLHARSNRLAYFDGLPHSSTSIQDLKSNPEKAFWESFNNAIVTGESHSETDLLTLWNISERRLQEKIEALRQERRQLTELIRSHAARSYPSQENETSAESFTRL